MAAIYCWNVSNALLLSFANLLAFHYGRHNHNHKKADKKKISEQTGC